MSSDAWAGPKPMNQPAPKPSAGWSSADFSPKQPPPTSDIKPRHSESAGKAAKLAKELGLKAKR